MISSLDGYRKTSDYGPRQSPDPGSMVSWNFMRGLKQPVTREQLAVILDQAGLLDNVTLMPVNDTGS